METISGFFANTARKIHTVIDPYGCLSREDRNIVDTQILLDAVFEGASKVASQIFLLRRSYAENIESLRTGHKENLEFAADMTRGGETVFDPGNPVASFPKELKEELRLTHNSGLLTFLLI